MHRSLYKCLPYMLIIMSAVDAFSWMFRTIFCLSEINTKINATNPPIITNQQIQAGYTLDCIASAIPVLSLIYLFLMIPSSIITWFCISACIFFKSESRKKTKKSLKICNSANIRCLTLTCNCPCYTPRPGLRFIVRFIITGSILVLRIIATILYGTANIDRTLSYIVTAVSAFSSYVWIVALAADYYQYRTWCYYRPAGDYQPCRCCCFAPKYHPRHEGYLPSPLLAKNRVTNQLGNAPCPNMNAGECTSLSLRHIAIFHLFDFNPQKRYDPNSHRTYFGFHQTAVESAIAIARNGFIISSNPPQMLGFGVYFARSFQGTKFKSRKKGAWICAEVDLKRTLRVNQNELHLVSNSNSWWNNYDSVYYDHLIEDRDEFCVKDPSQILKWIIIVNDQRVMDYKLQESIEKTVCGCI